MSTSRSNRRVIAKDTLDRLKAGHYTNAAGKVVHLAKSLKTAQRLTQVYTPTVTDTLLEQYQVPVTPFSTTYQVTKESTLDAVRRLLQEGHSQVLALNFASAKHPGGGFLTGSQAQEESLARSTGLYACLLEGEEYYAVNRKTTSCLYTDYLIYSPNVPVLKDDKGQYLPTLELASFITCPAVNTGVVKQQEANRVHEIPTVMQQRMAKVLAVAHSKGHRHLVLGAWGCGVFQNEPADIARYFYEALEGTFKGAFETVVFPIYTKEEHFIKPFQELFEA